MEIEKYLQELGSTSYAPGGGSAVCYVVKIANALGLKSLRITANRKSFQNGPEENKKLFAEVIDIIERSNKNLDEFEKLDQEAFNLFMSSYKSKDENAIKIATFKCFDVPKKVFNLIYSNEIELKKCSSLIASSITSDFQMALEFYKSCKVGCLETMKMNIGNYEELKQEFEKLERL